MTDIISREMRPDELDKMLELRNAVFGDVPIEAWRRDGTQTAAMAFKDGEVVASIPLSLRRFQIRPGQAIRTAFENAVGVREDMRGTGIGTQVLDSAAEFLKDRCDALFVYRGGERSAGYRFYQKTRHVDLHYVVTYALAEPQPRETRATLGDIKQLIASEEEILPVFNSAYGGFAGFPTREIGYWERQMRSTIFDALPSEFATLWLRRDGKLVGYAVLCTRTLRWVDKRWHIFEMAVENNDPVLAEEMMAAVCDLAVQRGFGVQMQANRWHPYVSTLNKFGFAASARGEIIQGRPLDFKALTRSQLVSKNVSDLVIKLYTPERDFTIELGSTQRQALLEMKDEILVRLLFGRIDLEQAIRLEQITFRGDDSTLETLATAFAFAPWVYHEIDYI